MGLEWTFRELVLQLFRYCLCPMQYRNGHSIKVSSKDSVVTLYFVIECP